MPPQNNLKNQISNQNKPETKIPSIRTLKTDISETQKKKEDSLSDIYQKQQEKRTTTPSPETRKNSIKKILIWGGGVLLFISLSFSLFFFLNKKETIIQIEEPQKPEALLVSKEEITLTLKDKKELEQKITELTDKNYTKVGFVYLPILKNDNYLTSKEFLNFIESKAPTILKTFLKDTFFLGLLTTQESSPLLIFEINKGMYSNVFSGMLRWEKDMSQDLNFILNGEIKTKPIVFKDKIIQNQNTRIIEENGEIVLLYTIFNKNYLIITGDTKTLEAVINQIALF